MKISVIVPVYNGENTIKRLVDELVRILTRDGLEIVLINDGSRDKSHEACVSIFEKYRNIVKYIDLARNFGEHNAVMAGLNYSTGDYAVIIDDDFQNPPEEIEKLTDTAIKEKRDAVYSYYDKKYHSVFRNLGSAFNNTIATFLLNKPRNLYLSSFKCINRFMINEILKYRGPFPYIDGLILRSTHNIGTVCVRHDKMQKEKSGYTLKKLISLWLNMFVNFSIVPLRISTVLGLFFSIAGGMFSVYSIIDKILRPDIPMGITSIFVAVLIFSGIQLLMLGLIGEYLGKLFLTDNQTPQYLVRDVYKKDNAC